MKKKLFCIVLPVLLINMAFSQGFHPTFGLTNEWNIVQSFEGTYTETLIVKDTANIEGTTYSILGWPGVANQVAFMWEDSLEGKIYRRPCLSPENCDGEDILFYDFSLEAGDSIELNTIYGTSVNPEGIFVVDSTNFITTTGGERKIMYLSHKWIFNNAAWSKQVSWVEGIGSLGNFLRPTEEIDEWSFGALSCFYKDDVKVFHSPNYVDCITSIRGIDKTLNDAVVNVFPNPFANTLHVRMDSYESFYIHLINTAGQIVYTNNCNAGENLILNLSHIMDGMYCLHIVSETMDETKIIVKQAKH